MNAAASLVSSYPVRSSGASVGKSPRAKGSKAPAQEEPTQEAATLKSPALTRYYAVHLETLGATTGVSPPREATTQETAPESAALGGYYAAFAAALGAATGASFLGGVVASKFATQMIHATVEPTACAEDALDAATVEALRREVRAGVAEALAPLARLADALQQTMSKATETVAALQKRRAG